MFSKMERKIMKKQAKANQILMKHDGIKTLDYSTKNLYIGNGGLGNGIKREELKKLFSQFGSIKSIVMLPGKPYSFIQFTELEHAQNAHVSFNGRLLKSPQEVSNPGVKFYTAFVETVPQPFNYNQTHPPGLKLLPDFIDAAYEEKLLRSVNWDDSNCEVQDSSGASVQMRSMKHRRVKHFGYEFIYGKNNVDKDNPLPNGLPSECDELINMLLANGHITQCPNQLTVNQYQPGQGIPSHIDTHSAFEDGIVSLSLGAQVIMDFKHPNGSHVPVVLPRRSVLIMNGESRYLWSHGITPRKTDIVPSKSEKDDLTLVNREMRTSFTFRLVRRDPCNCNYPECCDSQGMKLNKKNVPSSDEEAVELEKTHVHQVYNDIASHFSDTRHSPWPKVSEFLQSLHDGAVVADIGCGNGKYLGVNQQLCMLGNDRSINLAQICHERNFKVFVCDCLSIPLRPVFDACICIAVIHHLSTEERRLAAIQELAKILCVGGKALIYVWALEQELNNEKSNYLKPHRDNAGVSDVSNCDDNQCTTNGTHSNVSNIKTVDSENIPPKSDSVDAEPSPSTSDSQHGILDKSKQNTTTSTQTDSETLSVHINRTPFEKQDVLVPWHMKAKQKNRFSLNSADVSSGDSNPVFHRFYHVFRQGELETICENIPEIGIEAMAHQRVSRNLSYHNEVNWGTYRIEAIYRALSVLQHKLWRLMN